jgi:hypothetical protein
MGVEIWNTEGQLHFDQVFALKETTCIAIFKKQKCHFFLFQKQTTGKQNRSYLGCWYQWQGAEYKEGGRSVHMVEIYSCSHV